MYGFNWICSAFDVWANNVANTSVALDLSSAKLYSGWRCRYLSAVGISFATSASLLHDLLSNRNSEEGKQMPPSIVVSESKRLQLVALLQKQKTSEKGSQWMLCLHESRVKTKRAFPWSTQQTNKFLKFCTPATTFYVKAVNEVIQT